MVWHVLFRVSLPTSPFPSFFLPFLTPWVSPFFVPTFQGLIDVMLVVINPMVILQSGIAPRRPILCDDDLRVVIVVLDVVEQSPQAPGHYLQPAGSRPVNYKKPEVKSLCHKMLQPVTYLVVHLEPSWSSIWNHQMPILIFKMWQNVMLHEDIYSLMTIHCSHL